MASSSDWNRDLILANFQAASGFDDISTCISILESHSWDLQISLNSLFADQVNADTQNPTAQINRNSPIDIDTPTYINLDPDPIPIDDDTANVDIETCILIFQVFWHDRTLPVTINDTENIGALKRLLEIQTGLSQDEINLEGWPCGDASVNDMTKLSTLKLSSEIHLVLTSPAKITVSPAQYIPCNIPACNISDDESAPEPRVINVDQPSSSSTQTKEITLVVNHNSRDYKLSYDGTKTIKHVKQELYLLTKISTNQQSWVGWPEGSNDHTKLGDLKLSEDHFLMLSSKSFRNTGTSLFDIPQPRDSGLTGSPEDGDLEEQTLFDVDDDALFDAETTSSKLTKNLLPRDSADTTETMLQFQYNFEERYGDFHPVFFVGSLKDAIDEAASTSASKSHPLLVYLHHDSSILTNIFCSQILCSTQFTQYVSQNFTIWPWDMTHESNRQRFFNLLNQHFGSMASNSVLKYRNSEYPLLIIATKSKSGLEVCSVLQANASLDEVMMGLINGYEVFEQTKIVEVKAENERNERETMKQEQDDAYLQSLAADRAKADAERIKVLEEKELQEKEHLEAQLKEAERISCQEQVPEEPSKDSKNITTIRLRLPEGENEIRRFNATDTLKVVYMFVASKGYSLSDHRIVTSFPRQQLNEQDSSKTLLEMKLCPQAALFVEEI